MRCPVPIYRSYYTRVSTKEQNQARQIRAFEDMGIEKENIYLAKQSGKSTDRPKLKEMLAFIRRDDIIMVESISRIARNTKDLLTIVETINSKDAEFVGMKESLDTRTPTGKLMLTVFGARTGKRIHFKPSSRRNCDCQGTAQV